MPRGICATDLRVCARNVNEGDRWLTVTGERTGHAPKLCLYARVRSERRVGLGKVVIRQVTPIIGATPAAITASLLTGCPCRDHIQRLESTAGEIIQANWATRVCAEELRLLLGGGRSGSKRGTQEHPRSDQRISNLHHAPHFSYQVLLVAFREVTEWIMKRVDEMPRVQSPHLPAERDPPSDRSDEDGRGEKAWCC